MRLCERGVGEYSRGRKHPDHGELAGSGIWAYVIDALFAEVGSVYEMAKSLTYDNVELSERRGFPKRKMPQKGEKRKPPDLGIEPRWLAAESGLYNIGLPPNV